MGRDAIRKLIRKLDVKLSLLLLVLLTACTGFFSQPQLTEVQLEELQSYQFETEKALVFKSALYVLQGLGYSIEAKDEGIGLISAKSLTRQRQAPDDCTYTTHPLTKILQSFCHPGERYHIYRRLSISLDQIAAQTHMRLSLINVNSRSGDRIITDHERYQAIFSRIEDRIFIRKNIE